MRNEDIEKLKNLQEIDSHIDKLKEKISSFPERLEKLRESLENKGEELNKLKEAIKKLEVERREKETELLSKEENIKKLQRQLRVAKTTKEYTSFLNEIEGGEKEKLDLEESIIVLWEDIEKEGEESKKISAELEKDKESFAATEGELNRERVKSEENLLQKEKEGEDVEKEVKSSILSQYERIRKKKDGLGITSVKDGACSGCSMKISSFLSERLKKGEVVYCENCSRILYAED